MNTGKRWTKANESDLIKAFSRKSYALADDTFCHQFGETQGFTGPAVRAKLRELRHQNKVSDNFPKVLLFDIETLPLKVYVWGLRHNEYIPPDNIDEDWCVSGWSAKWLFQPEMYSEFLTPKEATSRNDGRILRPLWKLLNEADVVIAQNGKRFDIRRVNARFVFYGLPEPMPYQVIDTYETAKQKFDFTSFKLDYMNQYLGLERKADVTMQDFIACCHGNKEALQKMQDYNKRDVLILEEFYTRVRGWIKHPNFAAWNSRVVELDEGEVICPVCRGVVTDFGGQWVSPAGTVYAAFRCPHCQAIGRRTGRLNEGPATKHV